MNIKEINLYDVNEFNRQMKEQQDILDNVEKDNIIRESNEKRDNLKEELEEIQGKGELTEQDESRKTELMQEIQKHEGTISNIESEREEARKKILDMRIEKEDAKRELNVREAKLEVKIADLQKKWNAAITALNENIEKMKSMDPKSEEYKQLKKENAKHRRTMKNNVITSTKGMKLQKELNDIKAMKNILESGAILEGLEKPKGANSLDQTKLGKEGYEAEDVANRILKETLETNHVYDMRSKEAMNRPEYKITVEPSDRDKFVEQLRNSTKITEENKEKVDEKIEKGEPEKSDKTEPEKSGKTEPEKSDKTEPEKSGKTEPEKSGKTEPEKSGKTEPEKSVKTEPEKSVKTEPEKSVKTEPEKLVKSVGDLEKDSILEKYRNDGFAKNALGWYFNPWTSEYDREYDPHNDSEYNDALKKEVKAEEKEEPENKKDTEKRPSIFRRAIDKLKKLFENMKNRRNNKRLAEGANSLDQTKLGKEGYEAEAVANRILKETLETNHVYDMRSKKAMNRPEYKITVEPSDRDKFVEQLRNSTKITEENKETVDEKEEKKTISKSNSIFSSLAREAIETYKNMGESVKNIFNRKSKMEREMLARSAKFTAGPREAEDDDREP